MDIFHEATKSDLAHCFVPELLTNFIRKSVREGKNKIDPTSFFLKGVCLLVDISGFTMMSETFCVQGKSGLDGLQQTTNGYMGQLVDVIYQFGGDIIKFAGDAVVCVFTSENFAEENHIPVEVILRAMHCARVIREVRTDTLTVHVAMSCGEMCFGILGGFENSWECLISGPCLHQLSDCLDDAPSMTSVLSPECSALLKQHQTTSTIYTPGPTESDSPSEKASLTTSQGVYQYELEHLPSGNVRIVDVTLQSELSNSPPQRASSGHHHIISGKLNSPGKKLLLSTRQKGQIDQLIRLFVPKPIGEELDNATGLNYFAEIREVTTMFMKVRYCFIVAFLTVLATRTCVFFLMYATTRYAGGVAIFTVTTAILCNKLL